MQGDVFAGLHGEDLAGVRGSWGVVVFGVVEHVAEGVVWFVGGHCGCESRLVMSVMVLKIDVG